MADEVLFARRGGLAVATLHRPQALNALSLPLIGALHSRLKEWERDPGVWAVLVRGEGRAFCAGGDVRAVWEMGKRDLAEGVGFFREEYDLILDIGRLEKPYLALCDGITMGGGCGISVNGSHRVATERSSFAMPEVFIGSIPDVGATRFLQAAPGFVGTYLALTGARLGAADAIYARLATHFVRSARLPAIEGPEIVQDDPGAPPLRALQPAIDHCFGLDSVEEIVEALEREPDAWAKDALAAMAKASPLALKLVLRQMRTKVRSLQDALKFELRLMEKVLRHGDFFEGVRALLVDKDRQPRWKHRRLEDVSDAEVERFFP